MSQYTPRKSGTRWRRDCPDYVLDVFDDDRTVDRYTVIFTGQFLEPQTGRTLANTTLQYLAMSERPSHPGGFSQWGEFTAYDCTAYRYRNGHHRIRWLDLPENIRAHVIARAT